ncbi:MAG: glutamate racemase [Betaproteobacteria bacterium]|nr:glutamate racemase [Betaproteobacteria bacterium]
MIGVFDSGLGGLSVLAAIARALPQADLLYLADSAHLPYGPKSDDFIRARVLAIGQHLATLGCDTIVVACNTATVAAVHALREQLPSTQVIGVEPGIKPAAATSNTHRIAVLATESTARSDGLARLIREHAGAVSVHIEACPGWATQVETLHLDEAGFAAQVNAKISALLDAGADRLVLGCTHYTFLAPLLTPLLAGRAELIDVADAVARQVVRLTDGRAHGSGRLSLLATANPQRLQAALSALNLSWLLPRLDGEARLAIIPA